MATMSKKHYEAIADVMVEVGKQNDIHNNESAGKVFVQVVTGLCIVFKKDNAHFQQERFIDACYRGVPVNTKTEG